MISYNHYIEQQFSLPLTYDLIAVFLFAITGSLIAVRRGYDPIGVAIITIISGAGGSILRDAVFLNIQPAAITNWYYSAVILSAFFVVLLARSFFKTRPIAYLIIMVEALGIGLNSVYGTQKSLATGLSIFSAIIIGINNAIGGRLMRDVIMGLKRKNLVPGRLYGLAAAFAIATFLILSEWLNINTQTSAWSAIVVAFFVRMVAVKFDLKSRAVIDYYDPSALIVSKVSRVVYPRVEKITKQVTKQVKSHTPTILGKERKLPPSGAVFSLAARSACQLFFWGE